MKRGFEEQDIQSLLNLYMKEARDFSAALQGGASWEELKAKRGLIKEISNQLNKKYEEQYSATRRRRDSGAPNEH